MEHWEALCPGGYRFVYGDGLFRPGTDSFALSALPRLKAGLRVCDLGCGTGLLGLLLLQRQSSLTVDGVDILPRAVAMAERAAAENVLGDRLRFHCADLRAIRGILAAGRYDLVVCNPPYYPAGSGPQAQSDGRRTARSEVSCTLEDVCGAASYLLRWGGTVCLVHKPERLTDLLLALREAGLEPKRLRFVCTRPERSPSLVLVEGRRGGKPGLTVEAPLILQTADGKPTAEADAIYFRQQEETP